MSEIRTHPANDAYRSGLDFAQDMDRLRTLGEIWEFEGPDHDGHYRIGWVNRDGRRILSYGHSWRSSLDQALYDAFGIEAGA